ncbi:MAG: hypothetical protein IJA48_01690 [Oscillospiraceae bacterium]|nr:hypothetical protein [Oscillospiraceae bacterium]
MSASRERKKRLAEGKEPVVETKETKKKISEGWIFAISIVLVLALVFGGIFAYNAWQRNRTVLTVGEHEIDAKEFNYFYNATATNFFNYSSYLGIDTTIPLDKQEVTESNSTMLGLVLDTGCLSGITPVDGSYGVTLAQVVADNAKKMAIEAYAIYDAAVAAGFAMDEECLGEVENEMSNLEMYAGMYGYSDVDELLEHTYGKGCTEETYRQYLEVVHVAQHYPNEIQYSDAEIAARYDEDPQTFDVATLYVYSTNASDYVEAAEDGTKPVSGEAEEAEAKAAAEAMANEFDLETKKGKVTFYTDYTYAQVKNLCGEEAAEWLFGEASTDGTFIKLFNNNDSYYVLKLLDKEAYNTTNLLQIFIAEDAEDQEPEAGKLSAAQKLDIISAVLQANGTKEKFLAMAEQYSSEDVETEVNGLSRADMNGVSEEACLWACIEDRAEGDWESFKVDGGYILLMYVGEGDSYLDGVVNNRLITEWITEITDAAEAACGYDEDAAMGANVGLVYNQPET